MDREEHTGLKNVAAIVFFLVLATGVYIMYRYQKTPTAAELHNIHDLSALPASKCTLRSGSFLGASVGNIYISKGRIREDVRVIEGGEERVVHRIFVNDSNGTMYMWFDTLSEGITISNVYANGGFSVADGAVTCSPWWITNQAAFLLPPDVLFPPTPVI